MDTNGTDNKYKDSVFIKSKESNTLPPGPPLKKKPKSLAEILAETNFDDTAELSYDDTAVLLGNDILTPEDKESIHDKFKNSSEVITHSIKDLIQHTDNSVDPFSETDHDIKLGSNIKLEGDIQPTSEVQPSNDINSRIEGKSLDELLAECAKDKDEWEEPELKKNNIITTDKGKYKKLKIIMITAIIIIVFSALVVNFIIIKQPTQAEETARTEQLSFDKITIPAYLQDSKQLQRYYQEAEKLYKKKRYKDAFYIFSQLIKTGWKKGLIYGMMGNCKLQLKDETAAKKYYTLSAEEGDKDSLEFALHLVELLKKDKNYSQIIAILKPFADKESSNQKLQLLLAESYYKTGDTAKTIECYKKLNPGNLSEKQLEDFAKNLELTGDKQYAFKIYLLLGKLYSNTDAYIKAESLAPDKATRLSVLSKIVAQTASTPEGNYYKLKLAVAMINAGNKEEGVDLLKSLKTTNLSKEQAKQYIELAPYLDNEPILTRDLISILNKYYPDDIEMHKKIMRLIQNTDNAVFCREFFSQEYLLYPENPLAAYFYAINSRKTLHKKTLLLKAIKLSPDFFEAKLALAETYIDEQKWKEAYKLLGSCIKQNSFSQEAQFYFTVTKINLSSTARPLKEYELFLKKLKLPEDDVLKRMVLMAEHMKDEKYPLRYLKQAEKRKSLQRFCEKEKIKIKLIYRSIEKKDFTHINIPIIKKYYIIYLISIGEERTVMNMPDDNNPDIEFWKLFIRWKRSLPSWQQKAYKLLSLKKNDYLTSTILKIWLKKLSPAEAEARLSSIPMIDRPFFVGIIAEQYRKDNHIMQSNIFFRKAVQYPNPNIYVKLLTYMKKN